MMNVDPRNVFSAHADLNKVIQAEASVATETYETAAQKRATYGEWAKWFANANENVDGKYLIDFLTDFKELMNEEAGNEMRLIGMENFFVNGMKQIMALYLEYDRLTSKCKKAQRAIDVEVFTLEKVNNAKRAAGKTIEFTKETSPTIRQLRENLDVAAKARIAYVPQLASKKKEMLKILLWARLNSRKKAAAEAILVLDKQLKAVEGLEGPKAEDLPAALSKLMESNSVVSNGWPLDVQYGSIGSYLSAKQDESRAENDRKQTALIAQLEAKLAQSEADPQDAKLIGELKSQLEKESKARQSEIDKAVQAQLAKVQEEAKGKPSNEEMAATMIKDIANQKARMEQAEAEDRAAKFKELNARVLEKRRQRATAKAMALA